jgi:acyl-CoA synthetase (AMP-forming)/AMP-acid ligase II
VLVNRWKAERALELIEEHGCSYLLAMPTHSADLVDAARQTRRDLSSLRALAAPGLTPERRVEMKDAFGIPPLGDYGLSEVPGHAAHGLDEPDEKIVRTEGRPTTGPRSGSSTPTRTRAGRDRRLGDRQRPQPLPRLPQQRRADARVADRLGRLSHRRLSARSTRTGSSSTSAAARTSSAAAASRSCRRRSSRSSSATRRSTRSRSSRCPTSGSASARARRSSPSPGQTAPTLPEIQEFLDSKGVAKYTWPESVEVFEDFPRTPSLKVVKRDLVKRILERSAVTA